MIDTVRQILAWTAWEMEVPKPYGPLHLGFTLVGFLLCALLAWKGPPSGLRGECLGRCD